MMTTTGPASLQALLDSDGLTVAGGAFDVMSAVLVEQASYVTGAGVTVSRLSVPDLGLSRCRRCWKPPVGSRGAATCRRVSDVDIGFGGTLNVARTIEEFGLADAAVHLGNQVFPKRCGHLSGKEVIPSAD